MAGLMRWRAIQSPARQLLVASNRHAQAASFATGRPLQAKWHGPRPKAAPKPTLPVAPAVPPTITHDPLHPTLRTRILKDVNGERWVKMGLAPELDPVRVREEGASAVRAVVERWAREELNVRASIQEDTMQLFVELMVHPITLAHFAHQLRLLPADADASVVEDSEEALGPTVHLKPSGRVVKSTTTTPDQSDLVLTDLALTYLGAISLAYPSPDPFHPSPSVTSLILPFYRPSGPPSLQYPRVSATCNEEIFTALPAHHAAVLLLRAGNESKQCRPPRPLSKTDSHQFKCAQLGLYGPKREKELRKLVPVRQDHWRADGVKKAEVLKLRWYEEEMALIPWRARMQKATDARAADLEARAQYRAQAKAEALQPALLPDEGEARVGGIPSIV